MLSVSTHLIPWAAAWSLRECKLEVIQTPKEQLRVDIPRYAFFAQGGRLEPGLVLGAVNRYLRELIIDTVEKRS